ncbi:MAG: hypothetical protein NVS3B20_23560 [Polyangiales bacterium]
MVDAPYPRDAPIETLANGELDLHDWSLPTESSSMRRAVVLVPRHLRRGERVPLLIALHGLAETVDQEMGAYAWVRRYGVADGYAHLRAPKSVTVAGLSGMVTPSRVGELQTSLNESPFRGMVIACPYTPNIWKLNKSVEATLDSYAHWLFETLVPRLRAETPVMEGAAHLGIDGVSLGGYASLGIGARRAAELGSIGCVQAAISVAQAEQWSARFEASFAQAGARPLHLLTSTQDVFRGPMEALDRALTKRAVKHQLRVALGPHDQPFLRGPGSVEMLLWHARALDV